MAICFRQGRFRLVCDCCDQEITDPCKGGVALRIQPAAASTCNEDPRSDHGDLKIAHDGFCRQHLIGRHPGATRNEFRLFQVLEALLAYRRHPEDSEAA